MVNEKKLFVCPHLHPPQATSDKLFVSLTFGPGGSKTTAMEIALAGCAPPAPRPPSCALCFVVPSGEGRKRCPALLALPCGPLI